MRFFNHLAVRIHLARMGYTPASLTQELKEEAFLRNNGCTMQEAADAQVCNIVNEHHRAMLGLPAELPF